MNRTILVALIQNAGLLLATVVAFDYLTARRDPRATPVRRVLAGLAIGAVGIAMIVVSVPFESGIVFDTRSVLLAISGLFLGAWPTGIAMAILAAFRVVLGGDGAVTGVSVILASGGIGVLWRRFRRRPLEEVSWRELYVLGIVVHLVMVGLLLTLPAQTWSRVFRAVAIPVMVVYPLATVALGILFAQRIRSYRSGEEIARSELRFRLLAENARDLIFRYEFVPEPAFTYVSPSSVDLTGYTPDEHYADPDLGFKMIHPEDRHLLEAAARGEDPAAEAPRVMRWIRKDGEILWAEQRTRRIFDANGTLVAIEGISRDVSESRRAEEQLRTALKGAWQAEEQLLAAQQLAQSTLDALREAICVLDEAGVIIAVNRAWRESGLGAGAFPESILTGASYLAVCDEAIGTDAELAHRVGAALRAVLAGEAESFSVEYPCDSPERRAWFDLQITRFAGVGPGRAVVAHKDITGRKTAESELRRVTRILEASQAAARVGGWELDLVRNSLYWTDETYRIHGTSPAEYVPSLESAIAFFSPESVPLLEEVLRVASDQGVARDVELELITRVGARKWVQFTPAVTTENGRTVRIACAIQDITVRKEAERERLELTAQLHQAQKLESLGSLAGGVAHDINNVLAAILSSASAFRPRLDESDPMARALDTIISACLRGRSVVRSLLYFARSDIGTRGPIDLNLIVRDVVDLLESTTLKRVRFTTRLQGPLSKIDGDRAALGHAVMNLCINSIDAMPDGGAVTITTCESDQGLVEISVRDTGTGMTPEVREKAIEPFFTTKPLGEGTGLGLAMVYGTIKAHDGSLDIVSSPGKGTTVVLRFPPAETQQPAEPAPAPEETQPSASLRILLVDDDELIREGLGSLLEVSGHRMSLAAGGAEAIALVESGLEVDLVILDMNMPEMTGSQTLTHLLELRPGLPVLLSSGHSDEEMKRLTGLSNVHAIQKPFTLEEFEAKLVGIGLRRVPVR